MAPRARNKFRAPGSKCSVLKKVLATLLGLFSASQGFGARGIVLTLLPLDTPQSVDQHTWRTERFLMTFVEFRPFLPTFWVNRKVELLKFY